ncbi:hypothetical protein PG995_005113 [Apiospora arundinis]
MTVGPHIHHRHLCVRTRYHNNQNHNLGLKRSHRLRHRRVHCGRPLHLGGGKCDLKYSDNPYDENLALGCTNATSCVEAWGNEHREYDFGKRDFGESTGHSTQLVWKYTTSIGCGARMCGLVFLCEYWPRGNITGKFGNEVRAQEGVMWRWRRGYHGRWD